MLLTYSLYDWDMFIIIYSVHWLILYFLRSVYYFLSFELLKLVCYWMFYKKWLLCIILKWLLSFIRCIDWFFTCLDLYVVYSYLNSCSEYFIGFFTRSEYFVWLWNNCYLTSSSLIDSLLAYISMLFLSIWIILAHMFVTILQEVISLYVCEMIIIL